MIEPNRYNGLKFLGLQFVYATCFFDGCFHADAKVINLNREGVDMEKETFMKKYGAVLRKVWGDSGEAYFERLKASPESMLKIEGLDPGTAKVTIKTETLEGTLDDQVRLWNDGLKSGSIDLYIPANKPDGADDSDLSDADLAAVAGGGDCCCCCTPCCSTC